jgi:hypothetical protein
MFILLLGKSRPVIVLLLKNTFRYSEKTSLDLSIFRAGPGSSRAEKTSIISSWENPAYDHPTRRVGPQFSGRA